MKSKILKWLSLIIVICVTPMVLPSCAEETTTFNSFNGAVDAYSQYWSSTIKGDTVIYECAQTLKVNYGQKDLILRPYATVKVYPKKDTIIFDNPQNLEPRLVNSSIKREKKGLNPIIHSFKKEFVFSDTEVICADVSYETYSLENEISSYALPSMSVTDVEFVNASITKDKLNENECYAELDFKFFWQVENFSQTGSETLTVEYLKLSSLLFDDDILLDTSFNTGHYFTNNDELVLFVDKTETWKYKGLKKERHSSPLLPVSLNSKENSTQKVDNFDFTSTLKTTSTSTDISKDNWNIIKNVVNQTITHSNQIDVFEDVFTYPTYDVNCFVWNQNFDFDLSFDFTSSQEVTTNNKLTATLITNATLEVASKRLSKQNKTQLELKNSNPNEDVPLYGKIISHFVSAIYDITNNTTKKCVIVCYEYGYEWGICEYEDDFPSTFTYTQSAYKGFNSVAQRGSDASFELAIARDTENVIFWYNANNSLISAIDALTCKVIGWKNFVNSQYCSKMKGYKQDFVDGGYILILTSPNGSTQTFSSYEQK